MTDTGQSHYGSSWSEQFIGQISDKELRDEYVADKVRTRIALMIRALREQEERGWSQTELGRRMGKPQSVVSRLEDPDYGKLTIQTLLDVASAFDLPLMIDIPEWDDWLRRMKDAPSKSFRRQGFNADSLIEQSQTDQTMAQLLSGFEELFRLDDLQGKQNVDWVNIAGSAAETPSSIVEMGTIGGSSRAEYLKAANNNEPLSQLAYAHEAAEG